jgi:hypothetical protein
MAHLAHRALPSEWSGGGYHVITVYMVDEAEGTALIGDLTDEPLTVGLDELAAARKRIAKQKHRLLTLAGPPAGGDLRAVVLDGLRAGHAALTRGRQKNSGDPSSPRRAPLRKR